MTNLEAHFTKMQDMMRAFLKPEWYVDKNGVAHSGHLAEPAAEAFIRDMIYMLDGPEQREAQGRDD